MPRKLLTLTAVLCIILCVAVGLVQVGRLLPTPPQTLAFNPPGCELPCVLNIMPGLTTKTQAKNILVAFTSFQQAADPAFNYQLVGESAERPYISIPDFSAETPRNVSLVRVAVGQSTFSVTTLGQLLAAGHRIKRIFRSNYVTGTQSSGLFLITFDDKEQIIAIIYAVGTLDESSQAPDIFVIGGQDQSNTLQFIRQQWHGDDEIRWKGFDSVEEYLTEPAMP